MDGMYTNKSISQNILVITDLHRIKNYEMALLITANFKGSLSGKKKFRNASTLKTTSAYESIMT